MSLEETITELGCTPLLVIRWLDDPELPAIIEAMQRVLAEEER